MTFRAGFGIAVVVALAVGAGCSSAGGTVATDAGPDSRQEVVTGDLRTDAPGDLVVDLGTDVGPGDIVELAADLVDWQEVGGDGADGTCDQPDDCPVGQACVDGKCDNKCRRTVQCSGGLACLAEKCSQCTSSLECDGRVCANGLCLDCTSASQCQQEYASGFDYQCIDGFCVPETCSSDEDCFLIKQVCDETLQRCVPCNSTTHKCEQNGYTNSACVEGLCANPGGTLCADASACPQDAPICGDNHVCRSCKENVECVALLPDDSATDTSVCTAGGKCNPGGECGGIEDVHCNSLELKDGLVCFDYKCEPCSNNNDCNQQYSGALCIEGRCTTNVDCVTQADCAPQGRICSPDHLCISCTTSGATQDERDLACANSFATLESPDWICSSQGTCIPGECESAAHCSHLPGSAVCDLDLHKCVSCNDLAEEIRDAACANAYGFAFICEFPGCMVGCTAGTVCLSGNSTCVGMEGQVCGADNRWRSCQTNAECKTGSGGYLFACVAGLCGGECATATDCGITAVDGMLCNPEYQCTECVPGSEGDKACRIAFSDPNRICAFDLLSQKHLCRPGCQSKNCPGGQICNTTKHCGPCANDDQCVYEYGFAFVCEPPDASHEENWCKPACTNTVTDCPQGDVCILGHCKPCKGDSECSINYGSPHLCESGVCVPGNCREGDPSSCVGADFREICVAGYCNACTYHDPALISGNPLSLCPPGELCCPAEHVCDAGKCYPGVCCSGVDCDKPTKLPCDEAECVNHRCECASDADCWSKYPHCMVNIAGACKDNKCQEVGKLLEEYGESAVKWSSQEKWCLLKQFDYGDEYAALYKCYGEGEDYDDPTTLQTETCLKCWTTGPGSSRIRPTPGSGPGNLQADKCYIEDPDVLDSEEEDNTPRCYNKGDAPPDIRFSQCKACNPSLENAATLFNWSPRTPTGTVEDLGSRILCDDPWYFGTADNPIPEGAHDLLGRPVYPYSGTATGRCWDTKCRGISWMPWLPVGFSGAAHTGVPVTVDGQPMVLHGTFGGGFGAL